MSSDQVNRMRYHEVTRTPDVTSQGHVTRTGSDVTERRAAR